MHYSLYSSSYYHHQIGSIHLSHCCHIFPWLCEMFVTSYSYTYCIYIMGKPGICFHSYCAESANSRIRFGLKIVFVYLYSTHSHYHHCANLSEDTEPINFLSDIFCRVREQDEAYSLSYSLYNVGLCVFSLLISHVMIDIIYILCLIIIIKSEVLIIIHRLGFGNETIVCAVCLSVFFEMLMMFCMA